MKRNNLTREEAEKRIRSQMTNEERIRVADRVIWNTGTLEDLEKEVRGIGTRSAHDFYYHGCRYIFVDRLLDGSLISECGLAAPLPGNKGMECEGKPETPEESA